jgi:hypothetical protein
MRKLGGSAAEVAPVAQGGLRGVHHSAPPRFALQKASFKHQAQVMGDRGLAQAHGFRQGSDTGLAVRLCEQHAEQLQTGAVGQHFERPRQHDCMLARE